jgi:small subunit ribosomal protein S1
MDRGDGRGLLTKTLPFGVFVRVAPGIEGLLPASRLPGSPGRILSEGDRVMVRVAEVDLHRHRVRLGAADAP